MFAKRALLGGILAILMGTGVAAEGPQTDIRPLSRADAVVLRAEAALKRAEDVRVARLAALAAARPNARPDHMLRYPVVISQNPSLRPVWTRAALSALRTHGTRMEETVPRDIANWCPAYEDNPPHLRRAFWVGMMSALAKHESTYRPEAVGGGNLWFGLLQIAPPTARGYGCRATTGEALKDPEDNLSCAVRIMNVTVPRDNAIAVRDSRWRGVAADWGPMTRPNKIAEMAAWTRQQEYCVVPLQLRPQTRPATVQASLSTRNDG